MVQLDKTRMMVRILLLWITVYSAGVNAWSTSSQADHKHLVMRWIGEDVKPDIDDNISSDFRVDTQGARPSRFLENFVECYVRFKMPQCNCTLKTVLGQNEAVVQCVERRDPKLEHIRYVSVIFIDSEKDRFICELEVKKLWNTLMGDGVTRIPSQLIATTMVICIFGVAVIVTAASIVKVQLARIYNSNFQRQKHRERPITEMTTAV